MTIGDILREAREKKGLSIKDVQEKTKIRSKYIRALEDEQFGLIPGETYIKVFLRGYARYLGLNGDYLVKEYIRIRGDMEDEPEDTPFKNEELPVKKKGNRLFLIFLLIVLLMAVITGIYMIFFTGDNSGQSSGLENLLTIEVGDNSIGNKKSDEDKAADHEEYTESFFPLADEKGTEPPADLTVESSVSEAADNEIEDNETADSETADSETADSETADSETADSETADTADNEIGGSETEVSIADKSRVDDREINYSKSAGSMIEDKKTADNKAQAGNLDAGIINGPVGDDIETEDRSIEENKKKIKENMIKEDIVKENEEIVNNNGSRNGIPVFDTDDEIEDRTADGEDAVKSGEKDEAIENREKIMLIVTERCWLRIKVDGQTVFEGIMNRGESREFSGKEELWLRIGNAGGVKVRKGNIMLGPWGRSGEVLNKSLSFKKDG